MKHMVRSGWGVALALGVLGSMATVLGGCTTARIPATSLEVPLIDIPLPVILRGENDLRSRSWIKAFQIMHERMRFQYAYGAHKAIDWDTLYTETAMKITAAEEERDRDGWYLALRDYVHSIPDGNVQIDFNEALRTSAEGASVGLALAQLADGTVIVCGLVPESPAKRAGIAWGATVLSWNDKPVVEALETTSVRWSDAPAATPAMRRQQQLMWLPRGGAGEACRITYQNPEADAPETVTLERVADDFETLALHRPLEDAVELFSSPVESRTLDSGHHYVGVRAVAPTLSTPFPVRDFRTAVNAAVDQEAPGLVLDLRGTQGGDPTLAPKMLASLVDEPTFYHLHAAWDADEAAYVVDREDPVMVEPHLPAYAGPIIVLVDGYTMGPAESMARFLQGRPGVTLLGESGTYGSPGVPDVELTLPGGWVVMYPTQRFLDEDETIQGATDAEGNGNVIPGTPFTVDRESARAMYVAGEDVVLQAAVDLLGDAG